MDRYRLVALSLASQLTPPSTPPHTKKWVLQTLQQVPRLYGSISSPLGRRAVRGRLSSK